MVLNPGLEKRIVAHCPATWQQGEDNISTSSGLWQFTDIPLGLFSTPAMFKCLMGSTVRDFIYEACLSYLMM
jgi:hypothetical protein